MQQFLSSSMEKDLGFDYILNKLQPVSPYGKEAKRDLKPFLPGMEEKLEEELDRLETAFVQFTKDPDKFRNMKALLSKLKEIRTALNKTSAGVLDDVELFEIKGFLFMIDEIQQGVISTGLENIIKLYPVKSLEKLFDPNNKGRKGFYIEDKYSETLKEMRKRRREIERKIRCENNKLYSEFEDEFNLELNPDGEIEVSKSKGELIHKFKQSGLLIYLRESFATITFTIRHSLELDELNAELDDVKVEEDEEEQKIRAFLTKEIGKYRDVFLKNIKSLAYLDLLIAKVYLAFDTKATRPKVTRDELIIINNGRHPLVEEMLEEKGLSFTQVSMHISSPVIVITGANMGGKTVDLKLVGLLTAMAQYGFFVPAQKMQLCLRRSIFFSGSFKESLSEGLSSFGAEIKAIGEVLNGEPSKGLVLIDELAKGTNPPEAVSIASALISRLLQSDCITLITTHFHELTSIEGVAHFRVKGLSDLNIKNISKEMDNDFKDGVETLNSYMDYHLEEVSENFDVPKDAIKVARIMGFDVRILDEAEKLLMNFR